MENRKILNTINIENIVDHTIDTKNGKKIYLDKPSTLQVYTNWGEFKTIVKHVERLDIREEDDGTYINFVCDDGSPNCPVLTSVFVPLNNTKCTITYYNPLMKNKI